MSPAIAEPDLEQKLPSRHPLDPLSAAEMEAAVAIVKGAAKLPPTSWFETIQLDEHDKATLKFSADGKPPARRAYVCTYDRATNETSRGVVDLTTGTLLSWAVVPGVQAHIGPEEFSWGGEVAKADPRFIAALAKRGISDVSTVMVESWAAGNFGIEGEHGERIAYAHCWLANESGDNPYGRPIANLHPVIDLRRGTLLRVDDFGALPLPPDSGNIRLAASELRKDLKPIVVTQPEGPSFSVDGQQVDWQKWRFRVGFTSREGLILHDIGYHDGGRLRPIMNRASLAEMVVPYGAPTGGNFRRNAFDLGEYGIGNLYDSLELGCDCLGHIHYFDVCTHDWQGTPRVIRHAICMHEEDTGLLWKFTATGQPPIRARARRLVISAISTIGNYVYGVFWYLHQDGTIATEIKATGIPFPTGNNGTASEWGRPMAAAIEGHVHQHIFSFRFDMAVDGQRNAVHETAFSGLPQGPGNPFGNAIRTTVTPLPTELQAKRRLDLASQRTWSVVNPERSNAWGTPVGYKLVPGPNALPFFAEGAPMASRAGFADYHFWATPYAPGEMFPAGLFPNQHAGGDGLPRWTKANRSLDSENIVVWYTMNYHHLSRPEDWPVQPVLSVGFQWMPEGFFDRNPALDVPPPDDKASRKSDCC